MSSWRAGNMSFGERLSLLRKQQGMTQMEPGGGAGHIQAGCVQVGAGSVSALH